jgi:uncharacterized protein (TIGR02246 family)
MHQLPIADFIGHHQPRQIRDTDTGYLVSDRTELAADMAALQQILITMKTGADRRQHAATTDLGGIGMKVKEPQQMQAAFEAAFNSGDINQLLALYEPEAVLAPQPGQRVTGLAAIKEAFNGFLALKGTMRVKHVYAMECGNIALLQGEWKLTAKGPDGKQMEMGSRTAEVVRKQPDGTWLYIIDHAFANDD